MDAAFLPSPQLGGYVVEIPEAMPMREVSDTQVEPRKVNIYYGIGAELKYISLAEGNIAQHLTQMLRHLDESHEREVADVLDADAAHRKHSVASPETYLSIRIMRQDCLHEV